MGDLTRLNGVQFRLTRVLCRLTGALCRLTGVLFKRFDCRSFYSSDSGVNSQQIISTEMKCEPCESIQYLLTNTKRL